AVDVARVRAVVPTLEIGASSAADDAGRASPGMDARHYAPRARLVVAPSLEAAWGAARAAEGRAGLVVHDPAAGTSDARVEVRVLPPDPAGYARLLYATLHDLDDAGVETVVVQAVPSDPAWWAIADRLSRGST